MYKPFKTIEDQVALLESRGVECGRGTDATLLREGYYSVINGYKDPFLDAGATIAAGDDRYIPGTRFEDILHLFDFDRRLRLATFGALTLAEAALRTTCAYCFSEMHQNEPNAYLNPRNLHQPPKARKDIVGPMIGQMRKIIDNGGKDPEHGGKGYLHHCLADHGGEVPLWVLTNDMTIGQVTNPSLPTVLEAPRAQRSWGFSVGIPTVWSVAQCLPLLLVFTRVFVKMWARCGHGHGNGHKKKAPGAQGSGGGIGLINQRLDPTCRQWRRGWRPCHGRVARKCSRGSAVRNARPTAPCSTSGTPAGACRCSAPRWR